jgi:threonine dehydrogenase-like Zn-dependent dehydrogenase
VPEEIADLAVLAEPLACSEKGCNEATTLTRARLGPESWTGGEAPQVAVTGMGPIGFTAVLAALARGWPVTMLGRDEPETFRARLVQRLGGRYCPLGELESVTRDVERSGFDLLLECTGSDEVLLSAALAVRSCGVIVWLGSNRVPRPATRNVDRLVREGLLRNHVHIGCVNADFRGLFIR